MAGNVVRVFEGVWIATGDEHTTLFKDCRIHGKRCAVASEQRWPIWHIPALEVARRAVAAASAKSREEFEHLVGAHLDINAYLSGTLSTRRKMIAAWLRQTVGFTRGEVLALLGRIACHGDAPRRGTIHTWSAATPTACTPPGCSHTRHFAPLRTAAPSSTSSPGQWTHPLSAFRAGSSGFHAIYA